MLELLLFGLGNCHVEQPTLAPATRLNIARPFFSTAFNNAVNDLQLRKTITLPQILSHVTLYSE
jgi:hypothetical protein